MLSKYWHSNNHCLKFNWLDSKRVIELFSSIWALSNIWLKVLSVDSNVKHKCMATLHPVCVRSPLRVMIWKSTDEDEEATNLSNTVSFFPSFLQKFSLGWQIKLKTWLMAILSRGSRDSTNKQKHILHLLFDVLSVLTPN